MTDTTGDLGSENAIDNGLQQAFTEAGATAGAPEEFSRLSILQNEHHSRRRFRPVFAGKADYRTNELYYYDALADIQQAIDTLFDFFNALYKRDVDIDNTDSIDTSKNGSWQADSLGNYTDELQFLPSVNISGNTVQVAFNGTTYTLPNSTNIQHSGTVGVFTPDYMQILNALQTEISNMSGPSFNSTDGILKIENGVLGIGGMEKGSTIAGSLLVSQGGGAPAAVYNDVTTQPMTQGYPVSVWITSILPAGVMDGTEAVTGSITSDPVITVNITPTEPTHVEIPLGTLGSRYPNQHTVTFTADLWFTDPTHYSCVSWAKLANSTTVIDCTTTVELMQLQEQSYPSTVAMP